VWLYSLTDFIITIVNEHLLNLFMPLTFAHIVKSQPRDQDLATVRDIAVPHRGQDNPLTSATNQARPFTIRAGKPRGAYDTTGVLKDGKVLGGIPVTIHDWIERIQLHRNKYLNVHKKARAILVTQHPTSVRLSPRRRTLAKPSVS
jgi:hypothetical protein